MVRSVENRPDPSQHGGLRERKKLAVRRALGSAAFRLATERGLENVTIEDITAEADVPPAPPRPRPARDGLLPGCRAVPDRGRVQGPGPAGDLRAERTLVRTSVRTGGPEAGGPPQGSVAVSGAVRGSGRLGPCSR